jgi:transmembrane sensor
MRLQAGERVRLSTAPAVEAVPRVDRPNIDAVMAWKRSEAVFDDATLADAVAEMNRYTRTPIVLLDAPALAGLRVSGLYRTSDGAGFARAVAALHGLRVHEGPGRLELARPQ